MTRMWLGIKPSTLCDQHLLGEHAEIHQEIGQLAAGNKASVQGHVEAGQIDLAHILDRHEALAEEMENRGMNYDSPLTVDDAAEALLVVLDVDEGSPFYEAHKAYAAEKFTDGGPNPYVDEERNRRLLRERCGDCKERMAVRA